MDIHISRLDDDVRVGDALDAVKGGWVGLTGSDEEKPPALISVGALRACPDPGISLRAVVVEGAATYVESANPKNFTTMRLVADGHAWHQSVIVVGSLVNMPDTCPDCGSMSHGPPCRLLP